MRSLWIGDPRRPALGWLDAPEDGVGRCGVLICPPIGYEYWSTHQALRALAARLAASGRTVLRLDYTGTGDAAGTPVEPGQWDAWKADVVAAAAQLRTLGCSTVSLVGVRAGALLALLQGGRVGATSVVAWEPIRAGRRYCRELRLLGLAVPDHIGSGGLSVGGSVLSADTLDAIGDTDAHAIHERPAPDVLLVDHAEVPRDPLRITLRALGADVDSQIVPDAADALDLPAEYATVPDASLDGIVSWLSNLPSGDDLGAHPAPHPEPSPQPGREAFAHVATFRWNGATVAEDVVAVGPDRLVAVRTRPGGTTPVRRSSVLWLNSGSEHHVGPGRAWVEYARSLAVAGWTSLRVDLSGWGESPGSGPDPGRPYDLRTIPETQRLVDHLQGAGPGADPVARGPVVVVGTCASAWIALAAAAAAEHPPFGIVALNPQLYWQPGDPIEANIDTETHVRRLDEIARWRRLNRVGLWDLLDRIHVRHPAATELRALGRAGVPILWSFADGDDGLAFLHDRVGRAWADLRRAPTTTVAVLPGLDHSMRRTWERHELLDVLTPWLEELEGSSVHVDVTDPPIDLRHGRRAPAEGVRSGASENPAGSRPLL